MQKRVNNKLKLLLTGGHAGATAYAVIQEIRMERKPWELYWVGSRTVLEGKNIDTLEHKTFPQIGVKVYSLSSGRLQRKFTIWTLISYFKIPFGFIEAFKLISNIKPNCILSFGGYTSFPVVVISYFAGIPIISHDQTAAAGRANIYSSFFSTKIAISRESSRKYFPEKKVILTGNPVEPEILQVKTKNDIGNPPTILITGGHSGSVTINNAIEKIISKLLRDFIVIHQCGDFQFNKFVSIKKSLKSNLRQRYFVYGTISHWNWPKVLSGCDLIISRAGANIVSQIMAIKRPSILIPIPFAYLDEQRKNAEIAKNFGIARIIEQDDLNETILLGEVKDVKAKWKSMVLATRNKNSPDRNAAKNIVSLVEKFLP
ncbi:hypothetical protein A2962_04900 [Candidatus Woesebacteria bacterium RIFCSPLOWO2_01_FULL_39_61]|uniref:Uncharacterized protein n=1 Tax=Candidatus Woesebacteria bacterium RIFCSPHIGHO2_02_FULL_39_13 TaxID=1802505 RepID=A0A1F7YZ27_9BACT|nr:MAG: hypothetical protein A2692_03150 [Candidatus Woesebacteria bacterium RIFCSPHIGHO2_01_FULL_39_95]OGM32606.1 MAG: hypothetical protein A3D01_05125 [Candidatus Woesebacteria bacterium RIFCSPHIGHO2_02_FULL_39_13]OGM36403.1 MAG: hypothetical protein A3E13_00670 [Candidatus Woesebacteria bacterium RIFCSPHIGHO2_12_FULL_40_20]OGM66674.1 MAG: hypothetical protein A2962_04900 [Candidatus Woesebacteria bacterium RIFCSPLOWO2_01_FULL_39_61]OGM72961.1 MAG: hypothetical protein A3H19_01350 [Candidatus